MSENYIIIFSEIWYTSIFRRYIIMNYQNRVDQLKEDFMIYIIYRQRCSTFVFTVFVLKRIQNLKFKSLFVVYIKTCKKRFLRSCYSYIFVCDLLLCTNSKPANWRKCWNLEKNYRKYFIYYLKHDIIVCVNLIRFVR